MYGPEQAALFLNKAYKISRYASQRVFKEMQGFPGNQANFGRLKVKGTIFNDKNYNLIKSFRRKLDQKILSSMGHEVKRKKTRNFTFHFLNSPLQLLTTLAFGKNLNKHLTCIGAKKLARSSHFCIKM